MTETHRLVTAARRARRLLPFALVAGGFVLGALVFGRCPADDPHADHARGRPATEGSDAAPRGQVWTCAMHPQIRASEPGQCPICGMDLIPVPGGDETGTRDATQLVLSERARILARLQTAEVVRQGDDRAGLRLLGRVEPNETTLRTITAWTGGRIDRLQVNVTGQRVRAGQVIATLYSPEVYAAHQDLIVARRQVQRLASSPPSSREAAAAALDAARERLRLLGIPDDELARMETEVRPTRAVPIRSPFAGTVIERLATEGAYVTTGAPLYRIANLSSLWVQLDAYESDLPRISVGERVAVEVEAIPGERFEGKVTFIEPTLDPQRRTARVRVEIDNRHGKLRPGMFATATVQARAAKPGLSPLVIPSTAPLFTGRRAVVYVESALGERTAYEPRTVRLGPRMGQVYPVVAGLSEGERVVTRGAFALDADLQIRGGQSMMTAPDDRQAGQFDAVVPLGASQRAQLAPSVQAYLELQRALVADDLPGAQRAAATLQQAVADARLDSPAEVGLAWRKLAEPLRGHSQHIALAGDLEQARAGFEKLSGAIQSLLQRFGSPLPAPLSVAFCPMAHGSEGASWVQEGTEIQNPYFGAAMRDCGEVREQLPSGAPLRAPRKPTTSPAKKSPAAAGATPPATPRGEQPQGHVH